MTNSFGTVNLAGFLFEPFLDPRNEILQPINHSKAAICMTSKSAIFLCLVIRFQLRLLIIAYNTDEYMLQICFRKIIRKRHFKY